MIVHLANTADTGSNFPAKCGAPVNAYAAVKRDGVAHDYTHPSRPQDATCLACRDWARANGTLVEVAPSPGAAHWLGL